MGRIAVLKDGTTTLDFSEIPKSEIRRVVVLTDEETNGYESLNRKRTRDKAVREFVIFRAQGRAYPRIEQGSKFPTAGVFFSNHVLGRAVFPPGTRLSTLHKRVSRSLNDVHIKTREVGDWRLTHSPGPPQNGGWSFKYEAAVQIKIGDLKRYIVLKSVSEAKGE